MSEPCRSYQEIPQEKRLTPHEIMEKLIRNLNEWSELSKKNDSYNSEYNNYRSINLPDNLDEMVEFLLQKVDDAETYNTRTRIEQNRKQRIATLEKEIEEAIEQLKPYPSLTPYLQAACQKFGYPKEKGNSIKKVLRDESDSFYI